MADSLVFGTFDEPIKVPAECSVCRFIPTINSPKKSLPLDLAVEVFNRTPSFTTLDSCKLVCRDWNRLMHEPTFMPAYCKQTKNVCGFILQGSSLSEQEFVSLEDTGIDNLGTCIREKLVFFGACPLIEILASSKQAGILLVVFKYSGFRPRETYLYIGKPSTEYWRLLPHPDFYTYYTVAAAVVVVATSNLGTRYKLIRLSRKRGAGSSEQSFHCEVFDSEEWRWNTVNDVDLGREVKLDESVGQPVTVGNLVHWLTTDHQVFAFNCFENSYFRFRLPEIQVNERDWRTLVDYEGKLGLMHTNREKGITRVWVCSMGGGWRLAREFELEASLKQEGARPVGLYNRDIIFLSSAGKAVFYNLSTSSILRSFETVHKRVEQIFPFRSDYEEVDLCVEDRRQLVGQPFV